MKFQFLISVCLFTLLSISTTIAQPPPPVPPKIMSLCNEYETMITISDAVPTPGYWQTQGGIVVENSTMLNTFVSNLSEGGNILEWYHNPDFPSLSLTIYVNYGFAIAGGNITTCSDVVQLSYRNIPENCRPSWTLISGGGNIINPTIYNTIITELSPGPNIFRWTLVNGECSDSDDLIITNNSPEEFTIEPDKEVCTDYTTLSVEPAPAYGSGIWSILTGGIFTTIAEPSNNNTLVNNLQPGLNEFKWKVTNGNCTDWDKVTITYIEPPQAQAGPDTIVCQDFINLYAEEPPYGTGFWRVIAGSAIITDPTAFNTEVTNLDYYCTPWTPDWYNNVNSLNVFEWVVQYEGCETTDQVSVLNGLPGSINAGEDQTVCANVVNLDALDEGSCAHWQWWEQLPDVGDFYNPEDGSFIADYPASTNMPFNTRAESIQDGITQLVWHKRNNFWDAQGNPIVCQLTDTVEITALGDLEDIQAGVNDAVCQNYYTLDATDPNTIFTPPPFYEVSGHWSTVFGYGSFDDPTYYNTTVRNIGAQTNIYRWTITNETLGCTMSDDVYIHSASPSQAVAGPDADICTDFASLPAMVPERYTNAYWDLCSGWGVITENSCTGFACNALASNLGQGMNVFLWHVDNSYTGPYGGYSVAYALKCESKDTLIINNGSITSVAANDIYICADTAQLNANVPIGGTGQWLASGTTYFASTGGLTSSLYNDVARNLIRGKNTFLWTITRGICSDTDQLIVWNNLPAPNPNAGSDQIICDNSTPLASNSITRNDTWYDITGTEIVQQGYSTQGWAVGLGSGTFDTPSSTNTWVRNVGPGDNEYIWNAYYHFTDYNYQPLGIPYTQTCFLRDTVNIYYNSVTSIAGPDDFVCGVQGPGASINLNADNSRPGVWTPVFNPGPSNIITPTAFNTLITNMQNGDHIYRWTVSNTYNGTTCYAFDDVTVQVRIPSTSVVANPSTFEVCVNQAPLVANDPLFGIGTWSVASATPGTIDDPTNYVTFVDIVQNGTSLWQWTVDYEGCLSRDTVTVINNTVYADADLALNPNLMDICGPDYELNATDPNIFNLTNPFATGTWTANLGTTTFNNNSLYNTTAHNLSSLLPNTLTWTIIKGGCNAWDQVYIMNNEFTIDASVSTDPNALETCNGFVFLDGEQPVSSGAGIWTYISGAGGNIVTPSLYNTQVNNIVPGGTSLFRWIVSQNGCTAYDDVTVTNNQVIANAGPDQTVYSFIGSTYMNALLQPGQTGLWTVLSGWGSIQDIENPASFVDNLNYGENIFRWNVSGSFGCFDSDEVVLTLIDFSAFAGNDQIVCSDTALLDATFEPDALEQKWSIVSGAGSFDDIYNPKTVVRNILIGANIYRWTVSFSGYSDYDDVIITNDEVFANAGEDASICNNMYQMNAEYISGTFNLWSPVGSGGGTIVNNTAWNTWITDLPIGDNAFEWYVDNGNCTSRDTITITRNPQPIADFTTTPEQFCAPENVLLENTSSYVPGFTQPDQFLWYIDGEYLGTTYSIDDDVWHIFTNTGQTDSVYTINMIAFDYETACSDTATQIILAMPTPFVAFNLDPHVTLFPNATVEFENLSDPDLISYLWDFGDGYNEYQIQWVGTLDHTYSTWGTYYITLTGTSNAQCEAVYLDSIQILEPNTVEEFYTIFKLYPNPASDHITIESGTDLSDALIEIENASGQTIRIKTINESTHTREIDVSNLAKGFYIVKIKTNSQTTLIKLIKE